MHRFARPHIIAWLVTGVFALLVLAAGPLVVVAMTRLALFPEGAQAAIWVLTGIVWALKVSAAAAVAFTGLHLLRRRGAP
jgi:hypothetical protein